MGRSLIEIIEQSITEDVVSVTEETIETHVGHLDDPEHDHLYVVVERAWKRYDAPLDPVFETIREHDRNAWEALYDHLDEQGLRAVRSPPIDAVERFAERHFRDRLEDWAEATGALDYSRVAHDVYFSKWWKLSDEEYYALDDRSLVADLESARQSLALLARGYATPGLRMSRHPTETEWGFVWQQYAWEGIVEHMLPVGSQEEREPYESWAQTMHRSSFREALNDFFFDAAREFVSLAKRIDERHGSDVDSEAGDDD